MNIYYIDYENVNSSGLKGIQLLDPDSQVNILYSKKADNVKIDALTELMKSKAEIHFLPVHVGTPNALDFQLVTLLFLHYQADNHYYIISKDSGYDCCIRTAQENGAPHVQRFRDIESSFQENSREQPSYTGQAAASGNDEPAAAPQVSVPSDTASAAAAADSPAASSDSPAHHSRRRRRSSRKPASSRTVRQLEEHNPEIPVLSVPAETVNEETAQVSLAESISGIPEQEQTSGSLTEIIRTIPSPAAHANEAWEKADSAVSQGTKNSENGHDMPAAAGNAGMKAEEFRKPEERTVSGSLPREGESSGKETAAGPSSADGDKTAAAGPAASAGKEETAPRPAAPGKEDTVPHPAGGVSDSHHRYPYGKISEVISRRCGFTPDEKQLSVIRDVLLKAKNKQQFYSSIVRRCGQKEGLALYHTIRCAYNDLLAIENK